MGMLYFVLEEESTHSYLATEYMSILYMLDLIVTSKAHNKY